MNMFRSATWVLLIGSIPFTAAPLNPSGDLDPTYDTDGLSLINITTRATFSDSNAVLSQSDGKIISGGGYYEGSLQHFALTRYNSDGSVDSSFGTGGEVKTIMGGNDVIFAMALQSDGKIVAVGQTASVTAAILPSPGTTRMAHSTRPSAVMACCW
ncbi:MAG: hypothetical protein IPK97_12415 [Ahniella sp.]|nr:hypothetical protein [Ahniella sp.]